MIWVFIGVSSKFHHCYIMVKIVVDCMFAHEVNSFFLLWDIHFLLVAFLWLSLALNQDRNSSNIPQLAACGPQTKLPLEFLYVYVLLNRNTENVVYLLKKFQVFSYLGSKCQKWCTNKRGQVPLLFSLCLFLTICPNKLNIWKSLFSFKNLFTQKTMFVALTGYPKEC